MDTFTPLWSKIVDSSLWEEPFEVRVLFVTMLAKKDSDHVVRASIYNLSKWANMDQKKVIECLKILESPDARKDYKQEFDGRRIEPVEEDGIPAGWLILKGEFYRKQMSVAIRRFKKTASEQKRRAEAKKAEHQRKPSNKPISAKNYAPPAYEAAQARGDFAKADHILGESLPASAGITKSAGVDDDEQPGFAPLE